jgi:hypothetical protein
MDTEILSSSRKMPESNAQTTEYEDPTILSHPIGIEVTRDVLRLNPQLPRELERLDMRIR